MEDFSGDLIRLLCTVMTVHACDARTRAGTLAHRARIRFKVVGVGYKILQYNV